VVIVTGSRQIESEVGEPFGPLADQRVLSSPTWVAPRSSDAAISPSITAPCRSLVSASANGDQKRGRAVETVSADKAQSAGAIEVHNEPGARPV
jgi:hypothetical protein